MSEEKIAQYLGITRKALWKIRKKMGWPQKFRSDKGKPRNASKIRALQEKSTEKGAQ